MILYADCVTHLCFDVYCSRQVPVVAQARTSKNDAVATTDAKVYKDKKRKSEKER